jgi:uncharacterized protein
MKSADYWIEKLHLLPHPEGGYYKEVYRSDETIEHGLPDRYKSGRSFSTSIYFLLKGNQHSAFHKIQSDEIWHFYAGSSVILYIISPEGSLKIQKIGPEADSGECFQYVIPKHHCFAAEVTEKENFCLVGCTVAPGFDFADFELAKKSELISLFPQHNALIEKFNKDVT